VRAFLILAMLGCGLIIVIASCRRVWIALSEDAEAKTRTPIGASR
jgi:hypothetical protein